MEVKSRSDSVCPPKSLVGLKIYISKTSLDLKSSAVALPLSFYIRAHGNLLEKLTLKTYVLPFRGMLINIRLFLVFS